MMTTQQKQEQAASEVRENRMSAESEIKSKLTQMKDRECHFEFNILFDSLKKHDPESLDILLNVIKKYDVLSRKCLSLTNKLDNKRYREEQQKWQVD